MMSEIISDNIQNSPEDSMKCEMKITEFNIEEEEKPAQITAILHDESLVPVLDMEDVNNDAFDNKELISKPHSKMNVNIVSMKCDTTNSSDIKCKINF